MYDILIKLALESLQKVASDMSKEKLAITLEAIKIRNQFVLKRYEYAFSVCEELNELTNRVDMALVQEMKQEKDDSYSYIDYLENEFHPKFYREFQKLRTKFELTNDLLSGYSLNTSILLKFNTMRSLMKTNKCTSKSDVNNLYRHVWMYFSGLMNSLVRVSANDLRFWLTDFPYIKSVGKSSELELEYFKNYFTSGLRSNYITLLEDKRNLELFWEEKSDHFINTYPQKSN